MPQTSTPLSKSFCNQTLGTFDKSPSERRLSMGEFEFFSNVQGASNANENIGCMQSMPAKVDLVNENDFHINPIDFDNLQTPKILPSYPGFGRHKQR